MSMLNMVGDDIKECPLCLEVLEVDDVTFYPCTCLYQICRFCWHRLRTDGNGLCPACRKAYPENPADFTPLSQQQIAALKAKKRHQDQQRKQKIYENRKHLANVRVLQKNLVFVVGLPMRLADSEVLKKHEYFGKFGKILKVVINQSTSYAGPQGPSASAYVTYSHNNDALRAIQSVNNITMDGRLIKTSLGTTKYCSHFMKNLPCPKQDCMYLHELADPDASFTKEEMHLGKHQEYEKKLHDILIQQSSSKSDRTTSVTSSNGLGTSTTNTYKNNSPTQLISENNSTMPTLLSSQSKEAWPSLNTISPSGNTIYNNAKDKKSQSTGKENGNINAKSDKVQKGDKQLKQNKSSKDLKLGKSKLKCSETNGQTKCSSSKSPDKELCNSLQSESSGDSTPEPCSHSCNEITSTNMNSLQKSDTNTENDLVYKTNSEDLSLNNGNSKYSLKPFILNDATADLSRLSIFDDNNSFFSTPSYKKYLNTERPLSSSVESHSLSPDSLCGRSPFEMAGDTNGLDTNKSLVKEINNASGTSVEYTPTITSLNTNSSRQISMLNDFLPLISSSEDWQAAFGFPNSASNQVDHRLFSSDSTRNVSHISNGITHANLQDFQGLQQNGDYLNGSGNEIQSDAEEHHLLDNKLYEPPRVSNSVSQFLTDYYKGNSKYLERFLETSTTETTQRPLFAMNNGCGESPNQNSNHMDNQHSQEYIEYYNPVLNAQRNSANLTDSKFSDLHNHINAQNNHVNQQNMSTYNSTNSNVQYSNPISSFRSNNHCHPSADDDLGFDPFQETQKAFALMENEMVLQQNSNRGHKYGESLSQRTRLPPPGFSHMNAFGIGVPRAQGSKTLPHLNVSNTTTNWGSMAYQQQMQTPSTPLSLTQQQQHIKGLNMVPDWTTLDPAIMSTSRNFGHGLVDKHDTNDGLFIGQKPLYSNSTLNQQQNQTQLAAHTVNSLNSIQVPHPSNGQFQHFANNQIHSHNALIGTPQHNNMGSNILNSESYNINHHNVNLSMPITMHNQWHNSEQGFYSNSPMNSDIHKYQISMPPGFQNSSTGGSKPNKAECIESN